jgi:NadR type nicotinamide-nucleotide adenylyltransferase
MPDRAFTPTRISTLEIRAPRDAVARIVVTGGECTGKTTLAERLAQAFNAPWVVEYARSYAASVGRPLSASDVEPIAQGQIVAEDAVLEQARNTRNGHFAPQIVVLDTDLVSTTVYADHYYGASPAWVTAAARERLADLYLLCAPDLHWEGDGIRDLPEARAAIHQRFVARLRDFGATTLTIQGRGQQRFDVALAAVRGWRAATARRGRSR